MSTNREFVRYEVAKEIIEMESGLVFQARMAERKKPNPSKPLIQYYTDLIKSLTAFADGLLLEDTDTINVIIDKKVFTMASRAVVSREAVNA
jgi:hypothetical protein